jgi:hypothetical protein
VRASRGEPARRRALGALLLALGLALPATGRAAGDDLPEILHVAVPAHLVALRAAELRLTYRAPRANVVALIQVVEDLDGAQRATRQRELSVVARAFGFEAGELVVPVAFATAGRKRIVLTLVTDERAESDPVAVEVDVEP